MDIYGGRRTRNWQGFLSDLSPTNNGSSLVTLRTTTTTTATTTYVQSIVPERCNGVQCCPPHGRVSAVLLYCGTAARPLYRASFRTRRPDEPLGELTETVTFTVHPVPWPHWVILFFFLCVIVRPPSDRGSLTRRSATGTHNTLTSSKQLRWNVADNVYHDVRFAALSRRLRAPRVSKSLVSSDVVPFVLPPLGLASDLHVHSSPPGYRHAKLVGVPGGRHGRRQRIADTRDDGHETQVSVAGRRQTDDLLPAQAAWERRVHRYTTPTRTRDG